jgi:hypothetical protein
MPRPLAVRQANEDSDSEDRQPHGSKYERLSGCICGLPPLGP